MDRLPDPTIGVPKMNTRQRYFLGGTTMKTYFEGFRGAIVDVIQSIHNPLLSFVKAGLVVSVKIGKMNLEPAKSSYTEWFGFSEHQEPTTQVITDVVKMWGNGVGAATEINVMGLVDRVTEELVKDIN